MASRVEAENEGNKEWATIPFLKFSEEYPGQHDNFVKTTRYTFWSFIPLTLFENFRNLTNCYFLLVLIMTFLPYSPVSWIFNLLPLLFVLLVSMVKSGIEDWLKRKEDKINNMTPFLVLRNGDWVQIESKDIHVGDILKVKAGQNIPCDMLFLTSSNPPKTCNYSETNLNGESAVKTMSQHQAFIDQNLPEIFQTIQFSAAVGPPSNDLYKFNAKLITKDKEWPISIKNVLLRGCTLKFTDWIMGVALRTGHDCTIMKNQREPPAKRTEFDLCINRMIIYIFIFKMIIVIILSALNTVFENRTELLVLVKDGYTVAFFKAFMRYFVLFSYMIPISLMVTIEIIRVYHMIIMSWDRYMVDEEFGNAQLHNSNMITSLYQVTHILSDKTGTLTENVMHLVNFVDSNGNFDARKFVEDSAKDPSLVDRSMEMFMGMTICNTIVVYKNPDGIIEYNSESPDESSFVKYTDEIGIHLIDRQPDWITIDNRGVQEKYHIVSHIPFDSARKRMTLVVQKEGSDELIVYSKGADNIMYDLSNKVLYNNEVNIYAINGLRTLVFCKRVLTPEEKEEWLTMFNQSQLVMENREEELLKIAPYVESKLDVIGITAVEDKLQPNVPEAISWLRQANISLWVLTGDKLETAIEIGKTSHVILPGADTLILAQKKEVDFFHQLEMYQNNFDSFTEPVLILTAETTELAFKYEDHFMDLALRCRAAIFSRVSPFMKAKIVSMVKNRKGTLTLAIGDGANDVGMIQEAHVGVGVKGREGSQAAQTADIAIPRFRHLIRLLAVHGGWGYNRLNKVAIFMIFKNFVFILNILWSAIDSLASPPDFYDDFYMTCFNLIFTLLPPFAIGFFEQNLPQQTLLKYPQLHNTEKSNIQFPKLAYYIVLAIYQSVAIYYVVRLGCSDSSLETNGTIAYFAVVYTVTIQLIFWMRSFNYITIFIGFSLTFVVLYVIAAIYGIAITPEIAASTRQVLGTVRGWFILFNAVGWALLPPFIIEYFRDQYFPTLERLLRERVKKDLKDPIDFTLAMSILEKEEQKFKSKPDALIV